MDTLESYRYIIQSLLTAYAAIPIANGQIDCYTVFDTKQDHYIDLPDEIASTIQKKWDNFSRKVLESLAIEAYRQGVITSAQVGRMLNLQHISGK